MAELIGRIRLATETPHILCVNETFLDHTIGTVEIEGYDIIARWDRSYERGGVCIFASCNIAQKVTHLSNSKDAERAWCMLHTDHGPFLLGAWYRPPNSEVASIQSCEQEHDVLAEQALGTLLVGDLNVHHIPWLGHSRETSVCGKQLRLAAAHMGLKQVVREPTRGKYLLDLALTDVLGTVARILPKIADHSIVAVTMPLPIAEILEIERTVWKFATADWDRLEALLQEEDWSRISRMTPDNGASTLSETLLRHANCCIQKKRIVEKKTTHPWLSDAVVRAIADKRDAEGTPSEAEKAQACSDKVMTEYNIWVSSVHDDLANMQRGSKAWWKKERQLQLQKQKCSSIPALKQADGTWACDNKQKANLLATTFSSKYVLAEGQTNEYSAITDETLEWLIDRGKVLHPTAARDIMRALRVDSATGPDMVPTRIIKHCADALAVPVYLLAMRILSSGHWPELYTIHWVACLHKKKACANQKTTDGST